MRPDNNSSGTGSSFNPSEADPFGSIKKTDKTTNKAKTLQEDVQTTKSAKTQSSTDTKEVKHREADPNNPFVDALSIFEEIEIE